MGLAQYTIVPVQDEWGVLHDGDVKNRYSTKEAAFESAGGCRLAGASRGTRSPCQRARPGSRRERAGNLMGHSEQNTSGGCDDQAP